MTQRGEKIFFAVICVLTAVAFGCFTIATVLRIAS